MHVPGIPGLHLTYCTNIHPGDGWDAVMAQLELHVPRLRARLSPDAPFGIGLRLSGRESEELLVAGRLAEFKAWLDERGCYVFTINGFPHGRFHDAPVKADVHAPDWRDRERVAYTQRLAQILTALLTEGIDGSISTSPLSYRAWLGADAAAAMPLLVQHIVEVVTTLVSLTRESGRTIRLAIEPEPDGLLETGAEFLAWMHDWMLPLGAPMLAQAFGLDLSDAEQLIRDRVQLCLDTCHAAIMGESIPSLVDACAQAGIGIAKLQVSSALRVRFPRLPRQRAERRDALGAFADPVYLHQVLATRSDGSVHRFADLPAALAAPDDRSDIEWRVHFHVPLFFAGTALLDGTGREAREAVALLHARRYTTHAEIETYTWSVLPPALRTDLLDGIEREFRWVLHALD